VEQVRVAVCAQDPISRAGVVNSLAIQTGIVVARDGSPVDVAVAVFDRLTPEAADVVHAVAGPDTPVVLLQEQAGSREPSASCWAAAVLPRVAALDGRLVEAVRAAAHGERASSDVLDRLPAHTRQLEQEMSADGVASLIPREIAVLRLVADGLDTGEIADKLCYSERTVKNILYTLTSRLNLHNRSHAVAYAMRAGII
jgi:DNA-binding NarL/FixJ family response regulator